MEGEREKLERERKRRRGSEQEEGVKKETSSYPSHV
jgi:hypothetical protein